MVILKELQSVLMPTCFMPISKEVFDKNRAADTGGVSGRRRGGEHSAATFLQAKRKKENKGKKERHSKQKLLRGFHQAQNVTVLAILERLKFKIFSFRPTMLADRTCQCSMALPL